MSEAVNWRAAFEASLSKERELRVLVEGLRTQLATQADLLAQIADHYPHTLRVSQGWLWIDDQRSNVHIDQAESRLG